MKKKKPIDYSLYLVTDRGLAGGKPTLEIVEAAVKGGVTCVQLREKHASTREFIEEATAVRDFLSRAGIPLIINDRLDVALAVEADGLHLGQTDMPLETARRIAGRSLIIGVSAESVRDAIEAENAGADYISASPVFSTPTKTDTAPPLGLKGVKEIRRRTALPLVAIGGLNPENIEAVIRSGADGVAVVSAIVCAKDPAEAARRLKERIQKARSA
ncbi:MAG: thiamine phosphate synthase [Deltaproteobacteria bacterium]|nr:thiamine phosphate synthase [Deltaproteobacteria bacterium]